MTKKRRGLRRAFGRGKEGARKLKHAGMSPELLEIFGKDATVKDAQALQLQMVQEVLQRGVELQLAHLVESILVILRDEFGFDEAQLARFAQLLVKTPRAVKSEEKTAPDNDHV